MYNNSVVLYNADYECRLIALAISIGIVVVVGVCICAYQSCGPRHDEEDQIIENSREAKLMQMP